MSEDKEASYLQLIFHAYLTKRLGSWSEAKTWAAENSVNENTMRGAWYKPEHVGMQVMSDFMAKLLDLTPEKVASFIDVIKKLDPVPESSIIWNSLNVSEAEKLRLVQISKAILTIEHKINKD